MSFRDAIDSVGAGPVVTRVPDPPPLPQQKIDLWGEILKRLTGGEPEPSKAVGEEIKPGLAPREEVHPDEELQRIS
ncbi:hypothetical protein [Inquilinus sp.]|uniref:hypothetical protein n=1 Tax=Inquilinus sp. TaxID=1932117 RepID=UPI0031DC4086